MSNVSNLKHSSESVGQVPVQSFEHVGDVLSFCTTASLEKEAFYQQKANSGLREYSKNYAVLIQDGSFIFIPKLPGIILVPWYWDFTTWDLWEQCVKQVIFSLLPLEINVKDLVQFGKNHDPPFFRHWNENSNSLGNYTPIFGVYIPQYMGHFVTLCFCDLKNIFSLWECVRIPLVCLKFSTIHISSSNLLLSLLNIIQHVNKICECTIPLPEIGSSDWIEIG